MATRCSDLFADELVDVQITKRPLHLSEKCGAPSVKGIVPRATSHDGSLNSLRRFGATLIVTLAKAVELVRTR